MSQICLDQSDSESNDGDQQACSSELIAARMKAGNGSNLMPELEENELNGGYIVYNLELPLSEEPVVNKVSNEVEQQQQRSLFSPVSLSETVPSNLHEPEPSEQTCQRKDVSLQEAAAEGRCDKYFNHEESSLPQLYPRMAYSLPAPESSPQNKFITERMGGIRLHFLCVEIISTMRS